MSPGKGLGLALAARISGARFSGSPSPCSAMTEPVNSAASVSAAAASSQSPAAADWVMIAWYSSPWSTSSSVIALASHRLA